MKAKYRQKLLLKRLVSSMGSGPVVGLRYFSQRKYFHSLEKCG